jgi:hypothetical protein
MPDATEPTQPKTLAEMRSEIDRHLECVKCLRSMIRVKEKYDALFTPPSPAQSVPFAPAAKAGGKP